MKEQTCWKEYKGERQNELQRCVIIHGTRKDNVDEVVRQDMFPLKTRMTWEEDKKRKKKKSSKLIWQDSEINHTTVTRGHDIKLKVQM